MRSSNLNFLRYAGSKRRLVKFLKSYLPSPTDIKGRYIDPFVGGGGIFLNIGYKRAVLSDLNKELMDLYRAIKKDPMGVWEIFAQYPAEKSAYYKIRDNENVSKLDLVSRGARTLYLNRTCFRGWWRYNSQGQFNVGYGGEGRRWAVSKEDLIEVARRLTKVTLTDGDFEIKILEAREEDFIFVDPPYQPGEKEMSHDHYVYSSFTYDDHVRLSEALRYSSFRGVKWAITTSSHPEILSLFPCNQIIALPKDPFKKLRSDIKNSGEVLICNYLETIS